MNEGKHKNIYSIKKLENPSTPQHINLPYKYKSIKCWHCHRHMKPDKIIKIPKNLGISLEKSDKESDFYTFDSYQCALAFRNNLKDYVYSQKYENYIRRKYRDECNSFDELYEAPPFYYLQDYGGPFNDDLYDEYLNFDILTTEDKYNQLIRTQNNNLSLINRSSHKKNMNRKKKGKMIK
ncbi:MAG: hypothetical protein ACOCRK_04040 [bacterium]